MQLNSFNHFRAIAIIFIIAGHSYDLVGMEIGGLFDNSIRNLITGGTSLFVFISGFLFHHVFYPKYQYKKFMIKKCSNVFLPYLILGFIPVCLYVLMKKDGWDGYFLPTGHGLVSEYIVPGLKYYISGRFLTAYWYIPFILATFILSPLHIKYIHQNFKFQLSIILFFSIISILIHRPVSNISVIQSILYFTPIYLIGITTSIHKEKVNKYLNSKEWYLISIVILLATFQAYLGNVGNYHKPPFQFGSIDLMYFQKIVLCFFFMIFLNRFETYNSPIVHNVASTSFTAFFIHPFILWILSRLEFDFIKQNSWLIFAIFVVVIAYCCVAIAKLFKKILPKYSRNIIGY
ncbi:MAG: acyltransferase family protein [Methylophaga sp.]|nr:acyltransferase family protein [Methylophaga sp.]